MTTSAARAQTYLGKEEELGLNGDDQVVVALATGHFTLKHAPSSKTHITARFALDVFNADTGRLIGSGPRSSAGGLSTRGTVGLPHDLSRKPSDEPLLPRIRNDILEMSSCRSSFLRR